MATLTASQLATYERALARANAEGVVLEKQWQDKGGHPTYLVFNPTTNSHYIVRQFGRGLECDCQARTYCKHRAIVRQSFLAPLAPETPETKPVTAETPVYEQTKMEWPARLFR